MDKRYNNFDTDLPEVWKTDERILPARWKTGTDNDHQKVKSWKHFWFLFCRLLLLTKYSYVSHPLKLTRSKLDAIEKKEKEH